MRAKSRPKVFLWKTLQKKEGGPPLSNSINLAKNDYQCRHIFPDGHRCGSPRMRNEDRCYYHHETRGPIPDLYPKRELRGTFAPLPPTSFSDIQENLDQVLVRLASNDLDLRRAGLLLYCLQIASTNLHHAQKAKQQDQPTTTPIAEVQKQDAEVQEQTEVQEPTTNNLQPTTSFQEPLQPQPTPSTLANLSAAADTSRNSPPPTTDNLQLTTSFTPPDIAPAPSPSGSAGAKPQTASSATAGESNRTST